MKKPIAYIATYTCYYLGDLFSRLMNYKGLSFLYYPYQNLMLLSTKIQDWGKINGPWKEPNQK